MKRNLIEIPASLRTQTDECLAKIVAACDAQQQAVLKDLLADSRVLQLLLRGLTVSLYLGKLFTSKPALLLDVLQDKALLADVDSAFFVQRLALIQADNDNDLDTAMRRERQWQMARFILRDIGDLCSTRQLMYELSWFADACIDRALHWHHLDLADKHGEPIGHNSQKVQQMAVIGMGKLGAYELNLSSDVDLVFAYPEAGQTNGVRSIDNQQFFTKLGQKLIKTMDKVNIDGFVFRMDMRLRPYGQSGALVLNFDATELYYADQGREWERYAMIKARCVAGNKVEGEKLLKRLKPFVYRKYTDFSAIQALREMKALINREVRRLGKQDDVKLGAGGIREVEFIAQSYQLIYGGRDEELQQHSVLTALALLGKRRILPNDSAQQLQEAYFFLRDIEHAIQAINDEQTQKLPSDEENLLRIAFALGFADSASFLQTLDQHRQLVREHFEQVVAVQQGEKRQEISEWQQIWLEDEAHFLQSLTEEGFNEEESRILLHLKNEPKINRLESIARERFEIFMPKLLNVLAQHDNRGDAVAGLVALTEAVLRRTVYLVLLNENPQALEHLVTVAIASPWIIQQLAKQPVLLDELLNAQGLGQVPDVDELRELLRLQGLRLPLEDQEAHMQMLRYFRLAHHLHIVAAEATGKLPLMKVSDYLTFLAEAILEYVLNLAWLQAIEKYGYPTRDGEPCSTREFVIVAYGKLGGIELSHQSDLDIIFLHNADEGMTDGEKSIDNAMFYTRMGQYIVSMLTTRTMLGQLYDVDMRLRPSGGSGLLVSSIDSFDKYQHNQAWTWEHQALVRTRAVAGHKGLADRFYQIRDDILMQQRDLDKLRQEVIDMRLKMYEHLAPKYVKSEQASIFHLKHSRGGIVDLEFMVQFAVLAWSYQYPSIAKYSDNIRILENMGEAGLISQQEAEALIDIYRFYRSQVHKLALRQEKSEVPSEQVTEQRQVVFTMWQKLLLNTIN